jgi:hypothetical protein
MLAAQFEGETKCPETSLWAEWFNFQKLLRGKLFHINWAAVAQPYGS